MRCTGQAPRRAARPPAAPADRSGGRSCRLSRCGRTAARRLRLGRQAAAHRAHPDRRGDARCRRRRHHRLAEGRRVTPRAFLLALAVLAVSPAAGAPRSSIPATAFADFAFAQHPGAKLPLDVRLRASDGSPLRLGDLFGGPPVLLDFEYARCTTLCGVMLDQVTEPLAALPLRPERDYRLVAIDIDPATTPQQATAFAHAHDADRSGMKRANRRRGRNPPGCRRGRLPISA